MALAELLHAIHATPGFASHDRRQQKRAVLACYNAIKNELRKKREDLRGKGRSGDGKDGGQGEIETSVLPLLGRARRQEAD